MLWEDIEEEFERAARRMTQLARALRLGLPTFEHYEEFFPVDIIESDAEIAVRADLPGFKKEEIKIRVGDNSVEIAAEHKEERLEKGERLFRAERRYGAVRRTLSLPAEVDIESAKCKFENGVLEIRFKRKAAKRLKEIKLG